MKLMIFSFILICLCFRVYPQGKELENLVNLSSDVPLEISGITVNSENPGRYEKFEITFTLGGTWNNPFDPDQIRVDAVIGKPDGSSVTLPGFFFQEYYLNHHHQLEKIADPVWKVRFSPELKGEYTYRIIVVNNGKEISTPEEKFNCEIFDTHHGYLTVSKDNPLYFEYSDGTPFFGISVGRIQADADGFYPRFAGAGGNFNRLFLTNGNFDIQELTRDPQRPDRGLGKMNLENSWYLDRLLELGENLGIFHILTLTNQYNFNRQWDIHTYNIANGGILTSKNEYWTSEAAMNYFERYLRYMVARYGYSTSVFSWDLWNEYSAMGIDVETAIPWHIRMAQFIDSLDIFNHIIHTNDGLFNGNDRMHALPEMEVVSTNTYAIKDIANLASVWTKRMIEKFTKPYILTEYGMGHNPVPGGYGRMDPERRMVHDGIWSPVMSGGAATGMPWEWNWLNNKIFFNYIKAVQKIVHDVPFSKRNWETVEVTSFTFMHSQADYYADVIVEGWPGNFRLNKDAEPDIFLIDEKGRVKNQESLNAILSGSVAGKPGTTSDVAFNVDFPVNGEFIIFITELRDTVSMPQLTVILDGKEVLQEDLIPRKAEDYHPLMHNQYFSVDMSKGSHTIKIINSGGGSIVTSFELKNFILKKGPDLEVRGIQTNDYMLLWLKNQKFTVLHEMVGMGLETQPEGILEIHNVSNGTWMAKWVNSIDATEIKTELVECNNEKLLLNTPLIDKSVVVKLQKF